MKNRIYHFHPKNRSTSGITIVYDLTRNVFAIARCSAMDQFCRRAGVRICETRLKTAPAWSGCKSPSFRSNIFFANTFGIESSPTNAEIDAMAYLFAESVALQSSDTSLVVYLAKHRPQIDEDVERKFSQGLESIGWTTTCQTG